MSSFEKVFGEPGGKPPEGKPRSGMQPISADELRQPAPMPPLARPASAPDAPSLQAAASAPAVERPALSGPRINPIFGMFTQPRRAMRQILAEDPEQGVVFLAMLAGVFQAWDHAADKSMGDDVSFLMIVLLGMGIGAATGVISAYMGGWLLHQACRIVGGGGDQMMTRSAMVWGSLPIIASGLLWIPELAIFREEMFTSEMPRALESPALSATLMAFGVAHLVLGVWGLVTMCKCVGEAHQFSAWRALGAMFVSGLLVVALLFALVFGLAIVGFGAGAMG
jgi:hypothetical protein